MEVRELLNILTVAERLKDTTRHCYTSQGRQESVAEHTWMMSLIALLLMDEFEEVDMNKVIRMCIIHDLGECFTQDIPAFAKNQDHRDKEEQILIQWLNSFPTYQAQAFKALFVEMSERQSLEAKVYKAIDSLEALIQHNFSDLSTWSENELDFNLHYGDDKVEFSPYFTTLREAIRQDMLEKIDQRQRGAGK